MPVDINKTLRKPSKRHMLDASPLARPSSAHRPSFRTVRQSATTATAVVKRCPDGQCRVEVPPWLISAPWWRSGRRVWIAIQRGSLSISPKPSGPRGMKRWSRRVRRVPLALARRAPSSHMPCGQKLSEQHARRRIAILGPVEATATLEAAQ